MQNFGTSPLEILAAQAMIQGQVFLDDFTYSASWIISTATALGATATVPVNIQIDGDSDFVVQSVNIAAYTSANPPVVIAPPNFLILIQRSGSGRQIMNQPQHVSNYCGNFWNNSFPGIRGCASLLQAKNTVVITLQNLSGTAPGRVDVALAGFKVFYKGRNSRDNVFNVAGYAL